MKKENKILLASAIIIFIILYIGIQSDFILSIDNTIYGMIQKIQNTTLTQIFQIITHFGGMVSLFGIAFVCFFIFMVKKQQRYGIAMMLNLMMSSAFYMVLKNIIQRPRPEVAQRLIQEVGYGFPSGHATNNMAFYALAIYFIHKKVKNKKWKNLFCAILLIIPLLIGFSRIYLRVHYASDVIAGFCLGIISVILFISFVYPKIDKEDS